MGEPVRWTPFPVNAVKVVLDPPDGPSYTVSPEERIEAGDKLRFMRIEPGSPLSMSEDVELRLALLKSRERLARPMTDPAVEDRVLDLAKSLQAPIVCTFTPRWVTMATPTDDRTEWLVQPAWPQWRSRDQRWRDQKWSGYTLVQALDAALEERGIR
jgi:hypothetical protein